MLYRISPNYRAVTNRDDFISFYSDNEAMNSDLYVTQIRHRRASVSILVASVHVERFHIRVLG